MLEQWEQKLKQLRAKVTRLRNQAKEQPTLGEKLEFLKKVKDVEQEIRSHIWGREAE